MTKFNPYKEFTINIVDSSNVVDSGAGDARSETSRAIAPGDVDLASLAGRLRRRGDTPPVGYVPGKTMLRDQVIDELECSIETAETLVDALEARGFVRFTGSRRRLELEPSAWQIVMDPASG